MVHDQDDWTFSGSNNFRGIWILWQSNNSDRKPRSTCQSKESSCPNCPHIYLFPLKILSGFSTSAPIASIKLKTSRHLWTWRSSSYVPTRSQRSRTCFCSQILQCWSWEIKGSGWVLKVVSIVWLMWRFMNILGNYWSWLVDNSHSSLFGYKQNHIDSKFGHVNKARVS